MAVKVVTGGIPPKKTGKAEKEIRKQMGNDNLGFIHTHKRNLTPDDLKNELFRGGQTEKLIIIGCSKGVVEKISKIVGKKPTIVIADSLNSFIQKKTA